MLSEFDATTGVRMVVPRGNLLGEEVEALRRRLGEALIADVSQVVVDLRPVAYISARAMGVLVAHLGELRHRGGDLRLLGVRATVRELFDLCGIGGLFEFLDADADIPAHCGPALVGVATGDAH